MTIEQVSVFLGNRPGTLANLTGTLADEKVNIRALYVADTADYGILRMVVDNTKKAVEALKGADFTVSITKVLAVAVNDAPGGLYEVAKICSDNDINIEYMYAFVTSRQKNEALVVIRTHDTEKAADVMKSHGVRIVSEKDMF